MLSLVQRLIIEPLRWSRFETAYGAAWKVPGQLERLLSGHPAKAMKAADALRSGLCHQDGFVSSAALPALPFLLRALGSPDDRVKIEVLHLLSGFAHCTRRDADDLSDWELQLRQALVAESARFQALARHPNTVIAHWGNRICEGLAQWDPPLDSDTDE